jgi:outer membrane protein assembly factor BamE (lipoprotein component of BamABCDE complex)
MIPTEVMLPVSGSTFRPRRAACAMAIALAVCAAGGCSTLDKYTPSWRSLGVYKIDVNQGNYLSQDMVDKLKVGMTQQQARQVLGTPLVTSPFRPDRWDYVYEYSRQGRVIEHRNFTVHFTDNKVARWEGDEMPQSVVELNRSASEKALAQGSGGEKSFWDRFLDAFRK